MARRMNQMDKKNKTVFIALICFTIVSIFWLLGTYVYARNPIRIENCDNVTNEQMGADISKTSQKKTLDATRKAVSVISNYIVDIDKIQILISTKQFKDEETVATFVKKPNGKCFIILAAPFVNFEETTATILHELGHYYIRTNNISISDYSKFMYGNTYNSDVWERNKTEDFCEEYSSFYTKKCFNLEYKKLTKYKSKPNSFKLYLPEGDD
jgi:hypothetical protein